MSPCGGSDLRCLAPGVPSQVWGPACYHSRLEELLQRRYTCTEYFWPLQPERTPKPGAGELRYGGGGDGCEAELIAAVLPFLAWCCFERGGVIHVGEAVGSSVSSGTSRKPVRYGDCLVEHSCDG